MSLLKILLFLFLYQTTAYAQEKGSIQGPEGKLVCTTQDCGFYTGFSFGLFFLKDYDLEIDSDSSYEFSTIGLDTQEFTGNHGLFLGYKFDGFRIEGLFTFLNHRSSIQFEIDDPYSRYLAYNNILNDLNFDFESKIFAGNIGIWIEPLGHWVEDVEWLAAIKPYFGGTTGVAYFDFDIGLDQNSYAKLLANEQLVYDLEDFLINDNTTSSIFTFGAGVDIGSIDSFLSAGMGYRYITSDPFWLTAISGEEINFGKLSNHKLEFNTTINFGSK